MGRHRGLRYAALALLLLPVLAVASNSLDCAEFKSVFARAECREALRDADKWPGLSSASMERAREYELSLPTPVNQIVFVPVPHVRGKRQ